MTCFTSAVNEDCQHFSSFRSSSDKSLLTKRHKRLQLHGLLHARNQGCYAFLLWYDLGTHLINERQKSGPFHYYCISTAGWVQMKDTEFMNQGRAVNLARYFVCVFQCFIQQFFICRPSDSIVSVDAGIKPRPVVILTLAVRHFNHSARSHPRHSQTIPLVIRFHLQTKN